MTKIEKLVALFHRKNKLDIGHVLKKTGINTERALRVHCSWLRVNGIIDLKIKWGFVVKHE